MHRKRAFLFIFCLLLLACGTIFRLHSAERQHALNRRLMAALDHDDDKQALALVNEGADPNTRHTLPPAPTLPELVRQLLHRSPPPVNKSPTALSIACGALWNDDEATEEIQAHVPDPAPLVQAMLRHRANINLSDTQGEKPLRSAIRSNRCNTVGVLLDYGADINEKATDGWTPLMFAVQHQTAPCIIRLLLERGAPVNTRDEDGWTPLMYAVNSEFRDPAVVRVLLEHGAYVNARTSAGATALYWAVLCCATTYNNYEGREIIRQLLACHADVHFHFNTRRAETVLTVVNQHGKDPALIALLKPVCTQSERK